MPNENETAKEKAVKKSLEDRDEIFVEIQGKDPCFAEIFGKDTW